MRDKLNLDVGDFFAIPDVGVLSIQGRDAVTFAQAQFMNDVAALAPGQWQWSGWLTPKGRVIVLFVLLRADEERLLLLPVTEADAVSLVFRLQGMVFRSKVEIRVSGDLHVSGRFHAPDAASGALASATDDGGMQLDFSAPDTARTLSIGPAAFATDPVQVSRWRAVDLAHGLPQLAASELEQWTPQQLSLDRLGAYSVKKGCYPGQEIVARTHFLGQAKRGLVRLRGAGALSPDHVIDADSGLALGQLVCVAGNEGLAVMSLDAGEGPFLGTGLRLERLPLLDGLKR